MANNQAWAWERITAYLGILFFVGMAVGLTVVIPVQPVPTDSAADIEEFFADKSGLMHTANWFLGVALVFLFLPFAAGLRAILGRVDVDGGMWSRTAFGIAAATVAVTGAGTAFLGSAMLAFDSGGLDADLMRWVLWADAFVYSFVVALGIGLFLAASSIVILRTGVLWNWLGWLGMAMAGLCLIGAWWPVGGDPDGAVAMLAFLSMPMLAIWSLLAGVNLLRAPARTPVSV